MTFNPQKGNILLSDPFLNDPNFTRSVVLLCDHNEEGSFGFVLNRPSEYTLDMVMSEMESHENPIFIGGPVQKNTLHFLHTIGERLTGAESILNDIYWSGDFEELKALMLIGTANEKNVRFFAGYSGWGPGQLEKELEDKSWVLVQKTKIELLAENPQDLWKALMNELGGDYKSMVNFPIKPSLN